MRRSVWGRQETVRFWPPLIEKQPQNDCFMPSIHAAYGPIGNAS